MESEQPSKSISNFRRDFMKLAASGTAAVSALAAVSASAATDVAVRLPENEPGPYDLVIAEGRCVDPETGLHAVRNVGIKGGRIAAISDKKLEGTKTLNAEGQIVAPGFIDLHATSGRAAITVGQLWEEETPKSRIVFIGSRGGVNSSEIDALFHEHSI